MRTTVTVDDELMEQAARYTGIKERSLLIQTAVAALVEREAARRLSRLGGTQPNFQPGPRKRYFDSE